MSESRLIGYIRSASPPLAPLPPPELPPDLADLLYSPEAGALKGIRALLFDVYGTLFTSAAGDISAGSTGSDGAGSGDIGSGNTGPGGSDGAGLRGLSRGEALDALAREYTADLTGKDLEAYFRREVLMIHGEARCPYPEVRVEEIWGRFLAETPAPPLLPGQTRERDPRDLALRYELAVNPVFPMPGAGETLAALRARGLVLGIISNAQFFTPLLFNAFFDASPEDLGFDPGLLIYSYELGEAKPSPALFAPALKRLASLGIAPEACIYVGNDMLNDIAGAAAAGFKTALFAGDGRSLRLRRDTPLPQGLRPDRIIRNLADLTGLPG
jgi:putative hydrolase of the HAD superfamily